LRAPGVSFDNHAADLLEVYRKEGSVDIRTRDGHDGSTLIETTIGSNLPAIRRDGVMVDFGDMTGDGCTDMLFTIDSTGGTYSVVLDAGTGKPLWKEVLLGAPRTISVGATVDQNRAC
jgi:hypothetical protein